MPSEVVASGTSRSFFDPVNLLLIGTALVITFLPVAGFFVVSRMEQPARARASAVVQTAQAGPNLELANAR